MNTTDVCHKKDAEIKRLFNDLFCELNHRGNEDNIRKALHETLRTQHRTLQQNYFRLIIVPSILEFAMKQDMGLVDLRNEASCELAKKLEPFVKNVPLPFY